MNAGAHQEVLAAIAHDLRLSLTHIKGFVSSLRRSDIDWDDDTRNEFLAEIELETDRLAQLVNSLLPNGASNRDTEAGAHGAYSAGPAV